MSYAFGVTVDVFHTHEADPAEIVTSPELPQLVIEVAPYLNVTVPEALEGRVAESETDWPLVSSTLLG